MEESFAVAKGVSPRLNDRGEEGCDGKAVTESVPMSLKGMETIMSLDSRSFGFLDFNDSSSGGPGANFVSKEFIQSGIDVLKKQAQNDDCLDSHKADLLCHIGHLQLLIEDYSEAMSSYQQFASLCQDTSSNASYFYGLALIYFAFGRDDWAVRAFHKVLSISPNFARLSEVHVRLGIIYKFQQEYSLAVEHFTRALDNPGPCSINKLEIHYHLGHIFHLRGEYQMTKLRFEGILASKNVPNIIKANTLRQLGWLYHTVPQVAIHTEDPHAKAVELLKLAVGTNPGCGQTWYFLGRCHAEQGQFKEAFLAYRQSVSKNDDQPDTWCAIGILYQQMGQARDSLQAYIRSIHCNISHTTTWIDMGLLYESCGQLLDSVLCYKNGLVAVEKLGNHGNASSRDLLLNRMSLVEQQILQTGGMVAHCNKSRVLPSLLEAWTCLIPQHLRSNNPNTETPILYMTSVADISSPSSFSSPYAGPQVVKQPKRSKDPIILQSMNDGWSHANTITSSHQLDGHGLPDFSPSTFPPPILPIATSLPNLPNSNNRFSVPLPMDSQGSFSSHHPQLNSLDNSAHFDSSSTTASPYPSFNSFPPQPHHSIYSPSPSFSNEIPLNVSHLSSSASDPLDLSFLPLGGHISTCSDPLHSSQSSLSESVHTIDYCPNPVVTGSRTMPLQPSTSSVVPKSNPSLPHDLDFITDLGIRVEDYLGETVHDSNAATVQGVQSKMVREMVNAAATSELEGPQARKETRKRSRPHQLKQGSSPKYIVSSPSCLSSSTGVNKLPSSLIESTRHHSLPPSNQHTEASVSSPPLSVPAPTRKPQPRIAENTTTLSSGNASDTSSGISSAGTKLSSSSSPSPSAASGGNSPARVDENNDCIIPVHEPNSGLGDKKEYMRESPFLPPSPPLADQSIDLHPQVPVYDVSDASAMACDNLHKYCTNSRVPICIIRGLVDAVGFDLNLFATSTLMKRFGDHEVEVREQLLQAADENWDLLGKKQVWRCESSKSVTTVKEYGDYQQQVMAEQHKPEWTRKIRGQARGLKMLRFGTNCDLSDKEKWKDQLDEIYKLPTFLRVNCPEANFLNHIGHTVLGMNSVQLYLKVPGCRTPGHQENNNFCSVNVNIGPGDCEWFAVSNEYWGVIHELCELHKISFLVGSWWPILEELEQRNVPVYRFTQYPGEIVWINPGTVHWVQANSCCNNVAWNNGPLTAHQFRLSWERYQWNKIQRVRSIVPMITLSWTLARKIKISDPHLFQQIRSLLESSYRQCVVLNKQFTDKNTPVVWHGHVEGEATPYCVQCAEEVFNFLFVVTNRNKEHLVYCHKCINSVTGRSRKTNPFRVLQQYSLDQLKETLSSFKAHLNQ